MKHTWENEQATVKWHSSDLRYACKYCSVLLCELRFKYQNSVSTHNNCQTISVGNDFVSHILSKRTGCHQNSPRGIPLNVSETEFAIDSTEYQTKLQNCVACNLSLTARIVQNICIHLSLMFSMIEDEQ